MVPYRTEDTDTRILYTSMLFVVERCGTTAQCSGANGQEFYEKSAPPRANAGSGSRKKALQERKLLMKKALGPTGKGNC